MILLLIVPFGDGFLVCLRPFMCFLFFALLLFGRLSLSVGFGCWLPAVWLLWPWCLFAAFLLTLIERLRFGVGLDYVYLLVGLLLWVDCGFGAFTDLAFGFFWLLFCDWFYDMLVICLFAVGLVWVFRFLVLGLLCLVACVYGWVFVVDCIGYSSVLCIVGLLLYLLWIGFLLFLCGLLVWFTVFFYGGVCLGCGFRYVVFYVVIRGCCC